MSVDLDEVHHHLRIHGLPARGATLEVRAAFRFALPRALAFAREVGVPLTLFAVSADLADPFVAGALRGAARDGHRVESHSATHPYDLLSLPPAAQRDEVVGSLDVIERVVGRRPVGFRAPGYLVDDALIAILEDAGLAFDASVLPSPAYFAAKAAIRGWLAARGRPSGSSAGGFAMGFAPRTPHRPGRGDVRAGGLVELPMATTPRLRLPLIGTLVGGVPPALARRWARAVANDALVSFELHAMDFLEASDPTVAALVGQQPELRRTTRARATSLRAFVDELRAHGFRPCTLEEAARASSAPAPCARGAAGGSAC